MSDYIPRLREELVAAATREQAGLRHRPRIRPRQLAPVLATAAVVAAVVVAVLVVELPADDAPVAPAPAATALTYRVQPIRGTDASADVEASADVLRERIAAVGISGATVSVAGDRIAVYAGSAAPGEIAALTVPGTLKIYDWETSVLGSSGRLEPGNSSVTGGQSAGIEGAVSRDEAARRAAKADSPGARIVRAEGAAAGGWFALAGTAALGNADIANASARRDPVTNDPIVTFDLDAHGQKMFSALTREVAHRGARTVLPGESMQALQHIAIVLDDRIASVPFIDFRQVPDGIDGREGAQIQGGLTPERTRQIAAILNSGPMPATLAPVEDQSP
jgi:preprotein translocase subunit SecD